MMSLLSAVDRCPVDRCDRATRVLFATPTSCSLWRTRPASGHKNENRYIVWQLPYAGTGGRGRVSIGVEGGTGIGVQLGL